MNNDEVSLRCNSCLCELRVMDMRNVPVGVVLKIYPVLSIGLCARSGELCEQCEEVRPVPEQGSLL